MLKKDEIILKKMDSTDVEFVLEVENNQEFWEVSENDSEYSIGDIIDLEFNLRDPFKAKQVRYIINLGENRIGTIDLTEIDFDSKNASVGVVITSNTNRKKGFAKKALGLLEIKAIEFGLIELKAIVHKKNEASHRLFLGSGYLKKNNSSQAEFDNADYINVEHYTKWLKK